MLAAAGLMGPGQPALAESDKFKLTTGAEYTTGDYGGSKSVDEWYVPFTGRYSQGPYVFRLTIPYVYVSAPKGTVVSSGGDREVIVSGGGPRTEEDGLGDIIAGLTYENIFNTDFATEWVLDVTGKIKFGTADEDKGLGTGKNDYTIQVDTFRYFDQLMPFATLGYTIRDEPSFIDTNDTWFIDFGGQYRVSRDVSTSLDYYYREAASRQGSSQKELTGTLGYWLSDSEKLNSYLIKGFGDGSPDWGAGVMINFYR